MLRFSRSALVAVKLLADSFDMGVAVRPEGIDVGVVSR